MGLFKVNIGTTAAPVWRAVGCGVPDAPGRFKLWDGAQWVMEQCGAAFADAFTRPDSSTSPGNGWIVIPEGDGQDYYKYAYAGSAVAGISNNAGRVVSFETGNDRINGVVRAQSRTVVYRDFGTADVDITLKITELGETGIAARLSISGRQGIYVDPLNGYLINEEGGGGGQFFFPPAVAGDVLRLRCSGPTCTLFKNGVQMGPSFLNRTRYPRHGWAGIGANRVDDFTFATAPGADGHPLRVFVEQAFFSFKAGNVNLAGRNYLDAGSSYDRGVTSRALVEPAAPPGPAPLLAEVIAIATNGSTTVAVGLPFAATPDTVMYSLDGVAWQRANVGMDYCTSVAWNGTYWLVGGSNNAAGNTTVAAVSKSSDGITWTPVTFSTTDAPAEVVNLVWNGNVWLAIADTGTALGRFGQSNYYRSTNGTAWTSVGNDRAFDTVFRYSATDATVDLQSGTFFIFQGSAVILTNAPGEARYVLSSDNLDSFEQRPFIGVTTTNNKRPIGAKHAKLPGGGVALVAILQEDFKPACTVAVTNDIDVWAEYPLPVGLVVNSLHSLTHDGQQFVLGGGLLNAGLFYNGGAALSYSPDGVTWEPQLISIPSYLAEDQPAFTGAPCVTGKFVDVACMVPEPVQVFDPSLTVVSSKTVGFTGTANVTMPACAAGDFLVAVTMNGRSPSLVGWTSHGGSSGGLFTDFELEIRARDATPDDANGSSSHTFGDGSADPQAVIITALRRTGGAGFDFNAQNPNDGTDTAGIYETAKDRIRTRLASPPKAGVQLAAYFWDSAVDVATPPPGMTYRSGVRGALNVEGFTTPVFEGQDPDNKVLLLTGQSARVSAVSFGVRVTPLSQQANLLSGDLSWSPLSLDDSSAVASGERFRSPTNSVRLYRPSTGFMAFQLFGITGLIPGRTYRFGVYVRDLTNQTNAGGPRAVSLQMQQGSAGVQLGYTQSMAVSTTGWTYLTNTFTAPAGTGQYRMLLDSVRANGVSGGGPGPHETFIDDWFLNDITT